MKTIYLGADHNGYKLKESIKSYLDGIGIDYEDMGNFEHDPSDDYPEFAFKVAQKVADNKARGILVCGSSIGVCIAANKVKGVYAAPVVTIRDAKLSREHNNSNVLCLSGWNLSIINAKKIIRIWLNTKFSQSDRHQRRVKMIKDFEK